MSNNELVLLRRIEELEKLVYRQPEIGGVWQSWTPTVTYAGGTTDPTSLTVTFAKYVVIGKMLGFLFNGTLVRGSGDRLYVGFTLPINYAVNFTPMASITFVGVKACAAYGQAGNRISVVLGGAMNSDGYIWVSGFYEIA